MATGTSSNTRASPALRPGWLAIDARTPRQLLAGTERTAELFWFFDETNRRNGRWNTFFEHVPLIRYAVLAEIDVVAQEQFFRTNLQGIGLGIHPEKMGDQAAAWSVIERLFSLYREVDRAAALFAGMPTEIEYAGMLHQAIVGPLSEDRHDVLRCRQWLVDRPRYPFELAGWPGSINPPCPVKDNAWNTAIDLADDVPLDAKTFVKVLTTATWSTQATVAQLTASAATFFQQRYDAPAGLQPHFGMYLAFIREFGRAQAALNHIPLRHCQYFYHDVLKLKHAGAVPDTTFVAFTAAPNTWTEVAAGTPLTAGKDPNGLPITYATATDTIVTPATVARFSTIYLADPPKPHKSHNAPKLQELPPPGATGFYAAPIANSTDGKGAPLAPGASWATFGEDQAKLAPPDRTMIDAQVGFAITSPVLDLEGGTRHIELVFAYSRPSETLTSPSNPVPPLPVVPGIIEYSGAKGWITVPAEQTACALHYASGDPTKIVPLNVTYNITLTAGDPPCTNYDPKTLGPGYDARVPALRVRFANPLTAFPTSDSAVSAAFLTHPIVAATVRVEVDDLAPAVMTSPSGTLAAGKPVPIFGAPVQPSAQFSLGCIELFRKRPLTLKVALDWVGLPNEANGLSDYFSPYLIAFPDPPPATAFRNDQYRVLWSALFDCAWSRIDTDKVPPKGQPDGEYLFHWKQPDESTPTSGETTGTTSVSATPPEGTTASATTHAAAIGTNTPGAMSAPPTVAASPGDAPTDASAGDATHKKTWSPTGQLEAARVWCADPAALLRWEADPSFAGPLALSPSEVTGFLQFQLEAPDYLFGQPLYATVVSQIALDNALAIATATKPPPPPPQPGSYTLSAAYKVLTTPPPRASFWQRVGKTLHVSDGPSATFKPTVLPAVTAAGTFPAEIKSFVVLAGKPPDEMYTAVVAMLKTPPSFINTATFAAAVAKALGLDPSKAADEAARDEIIGWMASLLYQPPPPPPPPVLKPLPPPPLVPMAANVRLSYTAEARIDFGDGTQTPPPWDRMWQISPFAVSLMPATAPLLPAIATGGTLFLGITGAQPPEFLSLLFILEDMPVTQLSATISDEPTWSCLVGDRWKAIKSAVHPGTDGFLRTGIIRIDLLPEADVTHTVMPSGYIWIRAEVQNPATHLRTIQVLPHATTAVWLPPAGSTVATLKAHFAQPLAPNSITGLLTPNPNIAATLQPLPSAGGAPPETEDEFITRVSERLRHKGRAVAARDYERIVLHDFRTVFYARALLTNVSTVTVIVLPKVTTVPTAPPPGFTPGDLNDMQTALQAVAPITAKVRVSNPDYDPVKVTVKVKFSPDRSFDYYVGVLTSDLAAFISPWIYDQARVEDPVRSFHVSDFSAFIRARPYVKQVGACSAAIVSPAWGASTAATLPSDIVAPKNPRSILIAAETQDIQKL